MEHKRELILWLSGFVVFEIAIAIVGMIAAPLFGVYCIAGVAIVRSLIRIINVVLCVLLVVTLLYAEKFRKFSVVVPLSVCAIELLVGLIMMAIPMTLSNMLYTSPEVNYIAAQGIRCAGFGMLIGMVLAVMAGALVAKKRIIIPFLIIVASGIFSIAVYYVISINFGMGLVSMIAVGFLQPFAFLFPTVFFEGEGIIKALKNKASAFVNKSSEHSKYSYLEAYKEKHR